jgi:hypothetical protein
MMAARLRDCLRLLRWRETELADASGHPVAEVKTWLDGRAYPPLVVAAWLEALVKAHLSVPPLQPTDQNAEDSGKMERLTHCFPKFNGGTTMEHNLFERPVTVFVGLGFPTAVSSVQEAYALLNEWPPSKQNSAHTVALNACRAALAGEIDAETARGMFLAFARRSDLLAPEGETIVASQETTRKAMSDALLS